MSLPPHVQWVYDHHPEAGSDEREINTSIRKPKRLDSLAISF
jgi:coproporphyrinogen III oxidase